MTPAPTEREARTVTLSDGSVWTWHPENDRWIGEMPKIHTKPCVMSPFLFAGNRLTASDHRKIADVLDPAAAPSSANAEFSDIAQQVGGMVLRQISLGERPNTIAQNVTDRVLIELRAAAPSDTRPDFREQAGVVAKVLDEHGVGRAEWLAAKILTALKERAVSLPAPHSGTPENGT
jgi:hypothetical protein